MIIPHQPDGITPLAQQLQAALAAKDSLSFAEWDTSRSLSMLLHNPGWTCRDLIGCTRGIACSQAGRCLGREY